MFKYIFFLALLAIWIFEVLCFYWLGSHSVSFLRVLVNNIVQACHDQDKQALIVTILYIFSFLILLNKVRKIGGGRIFKNIDIWFCGFFVCGLGTYFRYHSEWNDADGLLTFLAAKITGDVFVCYVLSFRISRTDQLWFIASIYICFSILALWHPLTPIEVKYRDIQRWFGAFGGNPNLYGLAIATGFSLEVGLLLYMWKLPSRGSSKLFALISLLAFCGVTSRGLLHSYSRGAWIAAAMGLGYLAYNLLMSIYLRSLYARENKITQAIYLWLRCKWGSLLIVFMSVLMITFWNFRETEWRPARRVFSIGNQNDFSWRNRVAAWEGALQMTANYPWFGVGWNRAENMAERFYRPSAIEDFAAFQVNDYLTLGATLGIPALVCFMVYIWLSLTRNAECGMRNIKTTGPQSENGVQSTEQSSQLQTRNSKLETTELDWLQTVCRSGAIILLVGFWFDGGLFKLPIAATFWILLELGRRDLVQQKETKGTEMGSTSPA